MLQAGTDVVQIGDEFAGRGPLLISYASPLPPLRKDVRHRGANVFCIFPRRYHRKMYGLGEVSGSACEISAVARRSDPLISSHSTTTAYVQRLTNRVLLFPFLNRASQLRRQMVARTLVALRSLRSSGSRAELRDSNSSAVLQASLVCKFTSLSEEQSVLLILSAP